MSVQAEALRVRAFFERAAAAGLDEDLGGGGPEGDVTTRAVVSEGARGEAVVVAKAAGVLCGTAALEATFGLLDPQVAVSVLRGDGCRVGPGEEVARLRGPLRAILTGERTALNLLGRLSGIATLTRAYVEAAGGVEVTETRKTTPGLRALEKYAVRVGGGTNHRFGLWDGVLVKDNHVAAAGGVGEAVRRARAATTMPVEVECRTLAEAEEAVAAGAAWILADNCEPEAVREIVRMAHAAGARVEASGGITLQTVAAFAAAGVDRISVGALTHSAPALDVALELVSVGGG